MANTASMCGVATSAIWPSSITAPTSASISGSRPASTSCSIEVLCLPTFSAPAILLSSDTRRVTPSLFATASASRIMLAARSRVGGKRQISTSVECVKALSGLKVRLPHNLSHISARTLPNTGDFSPARSNTAARAVTRADTLPSSSPNGKRSPSICRTTPGATSSQAG